MVEQRLNIIVSKTHALDMHKKFLFFELILFFMILYTQHTDLLLQFKNYKVKFLKYSPLKNKIIKIHYFTHKYRDVSQEYIFLLSFFFCFSFFYFLFIGYQLEPNGFKFAMIHLGVLNSWYLDFNILQN